MSGAMPYVLTIITVVFIAFGQVLFKKTAANLTGFNLNDIVFNSKVMIPFIGALFLYGTATILWIIALKDLPLSRAYVFMAISFVIVPVFSAVLFSEQISLAYVIGVGLIVAGILVTQVFG
jgi:multidrug transporter EmrE-like cation transporter